MPAHASAAVPARTCGTPYPSRLIRKSTRQLSRTRAVIPDPRGQRSEDDDLRADGQVLVVIAGVGHGEVHAAVRPLGEAAAVERDAARREERRPRHRLVIDVADEGEA